MDRISLETMEASTAQLECVGRCLQALQKIPKDHRPASIPALQSWIKQRGLHRVRFNVDAVHFASRIADNLLPESKIREKIRAVANYLAGEKGPLARLPGVPVICASPELEGLAENRAAAVASQLSLDVVESMCLSVRARWLSQSAFVLKAVDPQSIIAELAHQHVIAILDDGRVSHLDSHATPKVAQAEQGATFTRVPEVQEPQSPSLRLWYSVRQFHRDVLRYRDSTGAKHQDLVHKYEDRWQANALLMRSQRVATKERLLTTRLERKNDPSKLIVREERLQCQAQRKRFREQQRATKLAMMTAKDF
mmetsp:Transcript_22617/g.41656  ORF Transcript_22617/g.41656 Transcript_22617/m.41656 type:complete len:309 (+) Transcript_22617:81-1007(+)